jgi:RNA methyltransferase, TrmH family
MLSKNELKYYSSLLIKKFRDKENKFIVEGKKIVEEAIESKYECDIIIVTREFAKDEEAYVDNLKKDIRLEIVTNLEFHKMKDTVSPQGIVAVFNKSTRIKKGIEKIKDDFIICLDNISNPGNLGTIIRNCDWFGFSDILLTNDCAEIFNPKTIRASMGSIFHLNIIEEVNLSDIINLKSKGYKILCSDLNGEDLYSTKFTQNLIIVFSNEANGPSLEILNLCDNKLTIPAFGKAESLNVASASAIILSEIRKKII